MYVLSSNDLFHRVILNALIRHISANINIFFASLNSRVQGIVLEQDNIDPMVCPVVICSCPHPIYLLFFTCFMHLKFLYLKKWNERVQKDKKPINMKWILMCNENHVIFFVPSTCLFSFY